MAPKPIIISGAGISGLALAQGLLKACVPFRIFERDAALNVRSQGYRVRINETGIAALTSLLPEGHMRRLRSSCGISESGVEEYGPLNLDAITAVKRESPFKTIGGPARQEKGLNEGELLTADRCVLRSVLFHGLESHVVFGKEVESFAHSPSGIIAKFSDNSIVEGCFLIGADGTHSKIRKQLLPDHKFLDTEGRFFYGKTTITPEFERLFNSDSMHGLTVIQDRSTNPDLPLSLLLEAIRFPDNEYRNELPADYVYWALCLRADHPALTIPQTKLLHLSPAECVSITQSLTSHWDLSFHALFQNQDEGRTSILRISSSPLDIPSWNEKRVTLIGDSIHTMSPTAGIGAVAALQDAAELVEVVMGMNELDGDEMAARMRGYEKRMRMHAREAIQKSSRGGKMMFGMRAWEELSVVD